MGGVCLRSFSPGMRSFEPAQDDEDDGDRANEGHHLGDSALTRALQGPVHASLDPYKLQEEGSDHPPTFSLRILL